MCDARIEPHISYLKSWLKDLLSFCQEQKYFALETLLEEDDDHKLIHFP